MFYKTSFLLSVLISVSGFSQNTFVPDDNFEQALIDLGLDSGPLDDLVPTTNINGISTLDLEAKNISNLTGIESFTALEELNCKDNLLTNIDISNNSSLAQLFVENNQLTSLDVTNNQDLLILWCDNNLLNTIDVSQNPELISLTCSGNLISTLNLSVNAKLNVLVCDDNQITNLDLSTNSTLNRLQCADNLLTSLNISQNPDLSILYCFNNQITNLDISQNLNLIELDCNNNLLSELDLSNNSRLTRINCSQNNLCSLNLKNGNNNDIADLDFSLNPNLNCVIVDSPNAINSNWLPLNFLNYVNTEDACQALIPVDEIDDFIGSSYTLPTLLNGNYHTEPNGNGIQLFAGNTITTTQTIYIFNSTQCYANESSFHVLISNDAYFIPKYFTPNNDSSHDTWRVIDNTGSFISINIYDRYGKLLKSLVPNNFEWDGTFNGNLLNTDDYWFVINRGSEIPIKGHFTLKR